MAYYTKNGQKLTKIFGHYYDPISGRGFSEEELARSGNFFPDAKSAGKASRFGYSGPTMEEQAARTWSEEQMADAPGIAYPTGLSDAQGNLQWIENPYAGTLEAPESILGDMSGVMDSYMDNYAAAQESLGDLRDIATSENLSPYARALMEQQAFEEQQRIGDFDRSQSGNLQNIYSSLMQSGGLDTGARESLAKQNMLNSMMGRQGIAAGGIGDRLRISEQDAQYKQGLLSSMPGQYANMATAGANLYNPYMQQMRDEQSRQYDINKYNIDQQIEELNAKRGFGAGAYQSRLDQWFKQKELEGQARAGYAEKPGTAVQDLY